MIAGIGMREILVIIIVLLIAANIYTYTRSDKVGESVIPYLFFAEKRGNLGLNIDKDILNYGHVPLGSSATRRINIMNNYDFPLRVELKFDGAASEWFDFDGGFLLPPHKSLKMGITLKIPNDAKLGMYEGNVYVEYFAEGP